ncbi:MAG: hypothetical protein IKY71_00385 [Bacteroidaceae bacterium]|nr:hypothetical protein [Bacteroidaceae bacterium]
MQVLLFLINLFAPAVNFLGVLGLCGCIVYDDVYVLVLAGIMAVAGLVLGIFAVKYDVPPRWFWSKSANQLFEFSVTTVLGYAGSLAMWPCAIYMVKVLADAVANAA